MTLGLVLMGLFIGELLVYTWCRVQYTRSGYDISRAVKVQKRLMKVQEELQVELARLKSPERLARIAETSMGLQRPTSRQMVVVE
jgi:cell division protein FtsL